METKIHPSGKWLVPCLFCVGIALAFAWYAWRSDSSYFVYAASMFICAAIFLNYYLSVYGIGDDGLYQHRRFSGTKFVPWEKIGNVYVYQGKLEAKLDMGDIRIDDPEGRRLMFWRGVPQPESVLNFIVAARALYHLKD
jgi:hypothetical protein